VRKESILVHRSIRTQSGATAQPWCQPPGTAAYRLSSTTQGTKSIKQSVLPAGKSCCICTLFRIHRRYRNPGRLRTTTSQETRTVIPMQFSLQTLNSLLLE
jgi:hypothetical protein